MLNKPLALRLDYSGRCNHDSLIQAGGERRIKTTTKPGIIVSSFDKKNGRNQIFGKPDEPLALKKKRVWAVWAWNSEVDFACISNAKDGTRKHQKAGESDSDRNDGALNIYILDQHQKGNNRITCPTEVRKYTDYVAQTALERVGNFLFTSGAILRTWGGSLE